jgi:hypothetical protein
MRNATLAALCVAAISVPFSATGQPRADCPYDPAHYRDEYKIRAEVSRFAELVAPSAAQGKRRSVTPPQNTFPDSRNFIDVAIFEKLKRSSVNPARLASDTEFLRRVSIDIAGRIPTPDEVRAFLADTSTDKRNRAIDRLLASDDFTDRWTLWFGDLVQNVYVAVGVGRGVGSGLNAYYRFIHDSIAAKQPYDAMVRTLLAGSGQQTVQGEANYFVRQRQDNGPLQDTYDNLAAQSGSQFLAMPFNCVSCHDGAGHLEVVNLGMSKLKRTHLWGMAAFFARTFMRYEGTGYVISVNPGGVYRLGSLFGNKTPRVVPEGQPAIAEPVYYVGGGKPADGEEARAAYGRLLTADRQFARATVNYIWKEMFGLGIVEPADSFDLARLSPPAGLVPQPTHPALLEQLTDAFIASGYDLRGLIRLMAQSSTYQLSARYETGVWNETWTPLFARHYPRRILAEVLLDSIMQATSVPFQVDFYDFGPIKKAVAAPDPYLLQFSRGGGPYGQFLADFGQGNRDLILRSNAPSLIQTLTMMNSGIVLGGIKRNGPTTVAAVLKETRDPAAIAERLYLTTLSRYPTADERTASVAFLTAGTLEERSEDLQYALLNKLEFLFN